MVGAFMVRSPCTGSVLASFMDRGGSLIPSVSLWLARQEGETQIHADQQGCTRMVACSWVGSGRKPVAPGVVLPTLQITAARGDFPVDSRWCAVSLDGFLQGLWHAGDGIEARQGEPQSTQKTQMARLPGRGVIPGSEMADSPTGVAHVTLSL